MKKIPTLFQRNYDTDRLVRNEVVPGCEWVLAGEGAATVKVDGTCCMIRNGYMYKRYELKRGKVAPRDFEPSQEADPVTGDTPGWVRVTDGPEDRWHREAYEYTLMSRDGQTITDGTYELIGPKVQGNPYHLDAHRLALHGDNRLADCPTDFEELKRYLGEMEIEGVVWWHPDGRMAKLKRRDFGFRWPKK